MFATSCAFMLGATRTAAAYFERHDHGICNKHRTRMDRIDRKISGIQQPDDDDDLYS